MKREAIIRAWKDPEFRAGLTPDERAEMPGCPAGQAFTELDESELADATGGALALSAEDGCICSNWTVPTKLTTTRLVLINPAEQIALPQLALSGLQR
ncbi:mersacidin/lichenicidin family type 2 lantibiotic [Stigmatella sp. ncwal1]|uniref:Mersacidin/lichenicidin family type 2 lantibiotic n=1 Tax=Stigmatella ashevillensis TaxID=2995309 RepID=A0ABT5DEX8_9BACT|nr:mersacidin/lichenicidin family type 2 lantibiotic [Stigmatella ashevillena]MDC0712071.1 mersacidin/lichenicidin family type 2 lantibiotic [Stigmatella ashevillena]